MHRHGIPTAAFATFTDHAAALAHVRALTHSPPSIVIKASGLAAGKGVILPQVCVRDVSCARKLCCISLVKLIVRAYCMTESRHARACRSR